MVWTPCQLAILPFMVAPLLISSPNPSLFSFFQGLSILHLEIILLSAKLCYAFEEISFFFPPNKSMKKSHSKLSKNEPVCMCKEG